MSDPPHSKKGSHDSLVVVAFGLGYWISRQGRVLQPNRTLTKGLSTKDVISILRHFIFGVFMDIFIFILLIVVLLIIAAKEDWTDLI